MERVIASHTLGDHRLDVVEEVDDDEVTVRLVVDGEVLPPDAHPDDVPNEAEAMALLRRWTADGDDAQVPYDGALAPAEVVALLDALDDEQKAQATYAQVLADFGDVRPFSNIVEAEGRHIEALTELMHRYGVPVPDNPWPGRVPRYASVAEACAAAVQAEIENGDLFDQLLAATERPDILTVFRNLQEASEERHLPAFRRCLARHRGDEGDADHADHAHADHDHADRADHADHADHGDHGGRGGRGGRRGRRRGA